MCASSNSSNMRCEWQLTVRHMSAKPHIVPSNLTASSDELISKLKLESVDICSPCFELECKASTATNCCGVSGLVFVPIRPALMSCSSGEFSGKRATSKGRDDLLPSMMTKMCVCRALYELSLRTLASCRISEPSPLHRYLCRGGISFLPVGICNGPVQQG